MRSRLVRVILFAAAYLSVGQMAVLAQKMMDQPIEPCQLAKDDQSTGIQISVAEVTFLGLLEMPLAERQQVSNSVELTAGTCLPEVIDTAVEEIREGWQDRGYFFAEVSAEMKTLSRSPVAERIALNISIEEGRRYNLGTIMFKNNKVIRDSAFLRLMFPISDGDVFSRRKIATGLENLRIAYGTLGYIKFTATTETRLDEENQLISLDITFDEDKQFYIGNIRLFGLDGPEQEELLNALPLKRGQIYNQELWEKSLLILEPKFQDCDSPNYKGSMTTRRIDERSGSVDLTLDVVCSD